MSASVSVQIKVSDLAEWDASHEVACELALQINKLIRNSMCDYAYIEVEALKVETVEEYKHGQV